MKTIKFFETEDYRISLQAIMPFTLDGVEQPKELLITIDSPFTKQKDILLFFDQKTALELLNEFLSVMHSMNKLKIITEDGCS